MNAYFTAYVFCHWYQVGHDEHQAGRWGWPRMEHHHHQHHHLHPQRSHLPPVLLLPTVCPVRRFQVSRQSIGTWQQFLPTINNKMS